VCQYVLPHVPCDRKYNDILNQTQIENHSHGASRGYEVLPDNSVKFGIRIINNSDSSISDVEVVLDYTESLFNLEGDKIQKLGNIPPTIARTAKFILKPLGCVHKENIGSTVLYKDHKWEKHVESMRPKEVHCVCPFLKETQSKAAGYYISPASLSARRHITC